MGPSQSAVQKLLNTCETFAEDNDLIYNCNKSFCMCIVPKCIKLRSKPCIMLDNITISYATSFKYLGVYIDENFNDEQDINRQLLACLYAKSNMVIKKFHNCSNDIKATLFNAYCSNLYCSQLWCSFKKSSMRRIEVAYNNSFKHLIGLSRYESTSLT